MQDYRIIVEYQQQSTEPKTSPKYVQQPPKTEVKQDKMLEVKKARQIISPAKGIGISLAVANKINGYVGELTENTVTQRRVQLGLTAAGFALAATMNPLYAGIAAATYVGNAVINYQIKQYKENLSADYLKTLSNGVVKTGR